VSRAFLLVMALLLIATGTAQAFVTAVNGSGNTRRWNLLTPQPQVSTNVVNTNTKAIRYFLASDGFSPENTTAELNAVRAAFAQWQAISGTHLKFEEAGLAPPQTSINVSPTSNIVFWAKNSTLVGTNATDDVSGALGVAFTTTGATDNLLRQGDIVFNGVDYNWFTDFSDNSSTDIFIESVALHEIGHFIGLLHSPFGVATMLYSGALGVNVQAGLSNDDISGARFLYPATTNYGAIHGTVTKAGSPVFGAAVFVRDAASNTVAGTVTRADGTYRLGALAPGAYQVRVAPLDPSNTGEFLVRGWEISAFTGNNYSTADTVFLPTTNVSSTVLADTTNTVNFAVTTGTPAFRITYVRTPTTEAGSYTINRLPTALRAGLSNRFISVFSSDLPTSDATFTITGDGLTLGAPTFQPGNLFVGLNGISMSISVSSNATPGARDLIVTHGGNVAYASGFFEVQATNADYNFDGLEDTFQRTYFPLFTATNAAPGADPDNDGFNNSAEVIAGTVPTNAASVLKMLSVARTNNTATVRWLSVNGKRYQLSYRTNLASGSWINSGSVVTATGTNALLNDTAATNTFRSYRVQVLP
jgi:hypothetical protein